MMEAQRELLARQLSRLGEQVSCLEREVADLRRRVESLEGLAPELDPAAAWLEQHPEEVTRHRGKQVAVHPKLGIVASADSFAELYAEVKRLGLMEEVIFDSISDGGIYCGVPG